MCSTVSLTIATLSGVTILSSTTPGIPPTTVQGILLNLNAGPTEALCPIDRDKKGDGGKWIPDISDRELNTIFAQISHAKGHNITFIADCCYSGSTSRGQETRKRSTPFTDKASLSNMLRAADERWKGSPGHRSILSQDWHADMSSHVALAACKDFETAKEVKGKDGFNGVFTTELVRALRSPDLKKEMTYVGLINLLNLSSQTPLVVGSRMNERLWYQADVTA